MADETRIVQEPVSFRLDDGTLTIRDEAGGSRITFEVAGDTSLTPASDSWFDVPIDGAVGLEATALRSEDVVTGAVRDLDGEYHGAVTTRPFSLAADRTFLDISASLKILVYVERGTVTGYLEEAGNDDVTGIVFEFDEPTRVVVGARSFHEEPAATMTVPDEPEALMAAASYLGCSIKEWSAERSWPTLRGHPPAIECGDELRIPGQLAKPETGVTVAAPADTAAVLRVTPLAHYLGAEVVPGDRAELRFDGHAEPLGSGADLEASVDRLLVRCTLLDSLVRIGGYYSQPRVEYDELAPELPFYPPELYDEPLPQQLREYLEVPFETLEPLAPYWSATGTLRPTTADAPAVPYLLDSLARVHVTRDGQPREPSPTASLDSPIRLSTASSVPPGVASLTAAGRRRTAEWERAPGAAASVLFVGGESSATGRFERLDWDRFAIGDGTPSAAHRPSVTRSELRTIFGSDRLFVHYGDRVTPEGFVCSDGVLGFDELPDGDVGALSFQWDRAELTPLTPVFDAATVACLTERQLSTDVAVQFGTALVLGYSVARGAQLVGFSEGARFLGDASRSLAVRPDGQPPSVFTAEAVDGGYRVTGRLPVPPDEAIGQVITFFPRECSDAFQLANTTIEFPDPVSADRLAELAENGGIIRSVDGADGSGALRGLDPAFDRC